mmetsp:Transcript_35982/g.103445  ORF Transcript_35982/g.103445 Transcript_35982/m.103445 type:complete len:255 (+) Transcript_35982:264-1028(+)
MHMCRCALHWIFMVAVLILNSWPRLPCSQRATQTRPPFWGVSGSATSMHRLGSAAKRMVPSPMLCQICLEFPFGPSQSLITRSPPVSVKHFTGKFDHRSGPSCCLAPAPGAPGLRGQPWALCRQHQACFSDDQRWPQFSRCSKQLKRPQATPSLLQHQALLADSHPSQAVRPSVQSKFCTGAAVADGCAGCHVVSPGDAGPGAMSTAWELADAPVKLLTSKLLMTAWPALPPEHDCPPQGGLSNHAMVPASEPQ